MNQAIGVIDSGVGGLTVAQELMRQLPKEKLIYLGDTKRCPYGPRSKEEVQKFTWEMVNVLLNKEIETLVIACNTTTAFTLPLIRKNLTIPVIGVIKPGARAAIKSTRNHYIGVIGTEGTIRSHAYDNALKRLHTNIYVNSLACPTLVPMVEQGVFSGEHAKKVVTQSLAEMKMNNHIDTLILGCTHYPLIKDTIQEVIGDHVTIVSSSEETARETSTILDVHDLLYKGEKSPHHEFYMTGDLNMFTNISKQIFQDPVDLHYDIVDLEKLINYPS